MLGGRYGMIPGSSAVAVPATTLQDPDEVLSLDDFVDGDVVGRTGNQLTTFTAAELAAIVEPELSIDSGSSRPDYLGAASAHDIEFASVSPLGSPGYSLSVAASGTAIDAYATVASNPRVSWAGALRPGFGLIQPHNNTEIYLSKTGLTLASDCWVWARCLIVNETRSAPDANEEHRWTLALSTDATYTDLIGIHVGDVQASVDASSLFVKYTAGVGSAPGTQTNWAQGTVPQITQTFIQKNGTTYHAWARNADLSWTYLGSTTHAASIDTIMITYYTHGGSPGSGLFMNSFLRYGEGLLEMPPT